MAVATAGRTPEAVSSLLGPVRAGNAFEETVERLLTVIKLGVVAPGDRFPAERELAGLLGVSRITLREAIRALQQAGYVESRRGRFGGTFVTYSRPAPDPGEARRIALADSAQLTDALAFRMALETGAAQVLATSTATAGATSCSSGWPRSTAPPRRTTGGSTPCSTWRSPSSPAPPCSPPPAPTPGCGSTTC